ncbi:MAG: pyridoxamine 5'-phosphate oxidase family protein, partial [Actinobacteria bacterium]|nr:pyridoxamine 5'-phosphate oxidase family protein [Actinomycetota bacterium]
MGEKTQIHRLPERGVTDHQQINEILDEGFVCHAAYIIEDRPVVIPTLYVRNGDLLLLHGSNSSGLVKAVRDGSPLSVGVTHIDGLVVARSGFHSSANYRSVVVHGQGRILTGEEHQ